MGKIKTPRRAAAASSHNKRDNRGFKRKVLQLLEDHKPRPIIETNIIRLLGLDSSLKGKAQIRALFSDLLKSQLIEKVHSFPLTWRVRAADYHISCILQERGKLKAFKFETQTLQTIDVFCFISSKAQGLYGIFANAKNKMPTGMYTRYLGQSFWVILGQLRCSGWQLIN